MKKHLLAKLRHNFSAAIPLTWIAIFQVLLLVLLYNLQMELDEQDNRVFTQQVFVHFAKDCENM